MPLLLSMLPGVSRTEVIKGRSLFCLGDFVATRTMRGKPLIDKSGLLTALGWTMRPPAPLLVEVAEDRALRI